MRIVIIVTQLEAGGAQAAALRLAAGLRQRGYECETWFLYRKRGPLGAVPHVRIFHPESPRNFWDYASIVFRLLRALLAKRPDAVISFTHYANVLGQTAALLTGVPTRIASQRNPSWSYPRAARLADRILGALRVYTSNIAVSRSTAASFDSYPATYRKRISVVYNGIEMKPATHDRESSRKHFGLPLDSPLLLAVGRLAAQKNHTTIVNALASLPGVHFAVAGEGELRGELELLARQLGVQSRVHLLGEVASTEVRELLAGTDAFVMPSRFEGMSNALLEAIGAGVPILASDIESQAEILHAAGAEPAGLLLPPDDLSAWSAAIGQVLGDDALRTDLAARAAARAVEFSLDAMIAGFEQCIRSHHVRTTRT